MLGLLILLVLGSPGKETAILKGKVTDVAEGAAIPKAYIIVHKSGDVSGDIRPSVQPDGSYYVNLSDGPYDVFVTSVGFAPVCTKVVLKTGQVNIYNPRLRVSKTESAETNSQSP